MFAWVWHIFDRKNLWKWLSVDMQAMTHRSIDPRLCGRILELELGLAKVALEVLPEMAADEPVDTGS